MENLHITLYIVHLSVIYDVMICNILYKKKREFSGFRVQRRTEMAAMETTALSMILIFRSECILSRSWVPC